MWDMIRVSHFWFVNWKLYQRIKSDFLSYSQAPKLWIAIHASYVASGKSQVADHKWQAHQSQ